MAIQGILQPDYQWLTPSRLRVLRELADERTEREVAERLEISYGGVRSGVGAIKNHTGTTSVREIRRWWRENREPWSDWILSQAGMREEGYPR